MNHSTHAGFLESTSRRAQELEYATKHQSDLRSLAVLLLLLFFAVPPQIWGEWFFAALCAALPVLIYASVLIRKWLARRFGEVSRRAARTFEAHRAHRAMLATLGLLILDAIVSNWQRLSVYSRGRPAPILVG